mmetsp:Transcript_9639/g.30906  ORF Transcript_9639/g.30906 Transcript_9639/m.30906 type:complete len:260 (+) Transcript_9639:1108-1887(+)
MARPAPALPFLPRGELELELGRSAREVCQHTSREGVVARVAVIVQQRARAPVRVVGGAGGHSRDGEDLRGRAGHGRYRVATSLVPEPARLVLRPFFSFSLNGLVELWIGLRGDAHELEDLINEVPLVLEAAAELVAGEGEPSLVGVVARTGHVNQPVLSHRVEAEVVEADADLDLVVADVVRLGHRQRPAAVDVCPLLEHQLLDRHRDLRQIAFCRQDRVDAVAPIVRDLTAVLGLRHRVRRAVVLLASNLDQVPSHSS